MNTFVTRVLFIEVHEWTDQGVGDHVVSKGGYHIGSYDNLDNALKEMREEFGELTLMENGYIGAHLIQDEWANTDPNGDFFADYTMIIERVERVTTDDLEHKIELKIV